VLASQVVKKAIVSVDSSLDWLDRVAVSCRPFPLQPDLVFADIGRTGDWGVPMDLSTRGRWPSYHEKVWKHPIARDADLYMIDGRFRVACFIQVLQNCRPDCMIVLHDFFSRPHYHIVREVAREVACVDDLAVFVPRHPVHRVTLKLLLDLYQFDPA
jgi:hypothetical protein